MVRIVEAADIKLNPGESIVETGDSKYTLVNCGKTWKGKKLYQAFNDWNICVGSILADNDDEAADKLGKKAFEESLNIEEVCANSLTEADTGLDSVLSSYITTISKALKPIVAKAKEVCKKVNLTRNIEGESDACIFRWYGKNGIQLFFTRPPRFSTLVVDQDFREWENLHAHLADQTPKPDLPLILNVSGHNHALKGYYKKAEATFVDKEIGSELAAIVKAIESGDVEKAAEQAFQKADPSTTNESLAESFDDWFEELNIINN